MGNKKGIPNLFMNGLMIVALLILASIITIIGGVPILFFLVALGLPPVVELAVMLVFGILVLGWTFITFGMRRRK